MQDNGLRCNKNAITGPFNSKAPIIFFAVEEVTFVEQSHFLNRLPLDEKRTPCNRINFSEFH